MRQLFPFAIPVSSRHSAPQARPLRLSLALTCLALTFVAAAPATLVAQAPPASEEPAEDANRKAANISWNPKLTFEEWKTLDKKRFIEFDRKLGAASFSEAERKLALQHLQNQIFGLTLEQNVDRHAIIIDNITRAAEQPGTSPAARDLLLENTLKIVEPLLKDQPPNVQYSLVLLIARLNSKAAKLTPPAVPAQPYPDSRNLLMKVLLDEQMPISARIIAARGLERLMRDGDLSTVEKATIGQSLADALKQKVENPLARKWFRWKLVDALGVTGRYEDVGKRPVMIDALMAVLTNPTEDWEVRSAAARSVSQLPLDQNVNVELVNYQIVRLLHDMAQAYNKSDKNPPSTWRWGFDNIYLAYKSATVAEQTNKHWGLMHLTTPRGKDQIGTAYKAVLRVVKPVLESASLPQLDAKAVEALGKWLQENTPPDRKVTPQSPQLELAPAPATPPAAAPATGGPGGP